MAGFSLLALLDDIATLLDDVAAMTKIAGRKTAAIVGDDLAVNAEQVTGVSPDRELPVVWAVAKGSTLNKVILVPAALVISAVLPWIITPLLMMGGTFLCFEGVEKLVHKFFHGKQEQKKHHEALLEAVADQSVDMVEFEKDRIKGAIRTDFILSAEIIVIALGTVAGIDFPTRVVTLVVIAAIMTVGVYGLVAAVVKLDDVGLHLSQRKSFVRYVGRAILSVAPYLMKGLTIGGTIAMLLVGGGIILHGIPGAEEFLHSKLPHEGIVGGIVGTTTSGLVGFVIGLIVVGVVEGLKRLRPKKTASD